MTGAGTVGGVKMGLEHLWTGQASLSPCSPETLHVTPLCELVWTSSQHNGHQINYRAAQSFKSECSPSYFQGNTL